MSCKEVMGQARNTIDNWKSWNLHDDDVWEWDERCKENVMEDEEIDGMQRDRYHEIDWSDSLSSLKLLHLGNRQPS